MERKAGSRIGLVPTSSQLSGRQHVFPSLSFPIYIARLTTTNPGHVLGVLNEALWASEAHREDCDPPMECSATKPRGLLACRYWGSISRHSVSIHLGLGQGNYISNPSPHPSDSEAGGLRTTLIFFFLKMDFFFFFKFYVCGKFAYLPVHALQEEARRWQ